MRTRYLMVQEKSGDKSTSLGETDDAIVGTMLVNVFLQERIGFADGGGVRGVVVGVVWGVEEEGYTGCGRRGIWPVNEIERVGRREETAERCWLCVSM